MSYYVKSLKLTFEQQKSFITSDDYGYPTTGWYTTRYTVTVKPWSKELLYKDAMDAYHRRCGDLVRVESIFELVVTKTNKHQPKINWNDTFYYDENGEMVLEF